VSISKVCGKARQPVPTAKFRRLSRVRDFLCERFIRTVADPAWQVKGVGDLDGDGYAEPTEGYLRTVADQHWQVQNRSRKHPVFLPPLHNSINALRRFMKPRSMRISGSKVRYSWYFGEMEDDGGRYLSAVWSAAGNDV
jgi:hypothetical protein